MKNDKLRKIVLNLNKTPNIKLFNKLVELVTSDYCRGGINRDGIDTLAYEVTNLACVKKGIKPVAWLYDSKQIKDNEYIWKDMKHIFVDRSLVLKRLQKSILVYNNLERAISLKEYLENNVRRYDPDNYDRIIGMHLGYSQDDIDFFYENKKKT